MSIYLGNRKDKNKKTENINTTDFLKKDGSIAMAGNLDLGNYAIDNLKTYPDNNKNAASKKYVDDECGKLLDLNANRKMTGDLNMNDNAIIGIEDISAGNSVPSKKFVKDENAKLNTKITANFGKITANTNNLASVTSDVGNLNDKMLFSHYFHFIYENPVASFPKNPKQLPAGFPDSAYFFHYKYNEKTKITLIALSVDSDTPINTNSVAIGVDIKFFDDTGGSAYKTLMPSSTKIGNYRKNTNLFCFGHSFSFVLKDLDATHFSSWNGFILPITCSWTNNEAKLFFSVDYY